MPGVSDFLVIFAGPVELIKSIAAGLIACSWMFWSVMFWVRFKELQLDDVEESDTFDLPDQVFDRDFSDDEEVAKVLLYVSLGGFIAMLTLSILDRFLPFVAVAFEVLAIVILGPYFIKLIVVLGPHWGEAFRYLSRGKKDD